MVPVSSHFRIIAAAEAIRVRRTAIKTVRKKGRDILETPRIRTGRLIRNLGLS